ncbi:major facilitator superfamily domain-containing protein [Biscogniauxia mediterranea]|nr:major facilitator superfamily domain-containing protein [Biscogniauxia mediterranea]
MSQASSPADARSSNQEKDGYDHVDLVRTATVDPFPKIVKTKGGVLLDADDLGGSTSLRLAADGHTVLIPQPTDDPDDPVNWSWTKKHLILFTVAWGGLVADWTIASGPTVIIEQAAEWGITPNEANRPNSISVLLGGLGGLLWVPMSSFWGRAPVAFWTTVAGLAVSIGAAVSPTYECYYAMRALSALFLTSGQTMSIAFLKDMFFFHERAQKIGLWMCLYIASPYLGPCMSDFVIYGTGHWPDVLWLCVGVNGLQVILILAFLDETWYNRDVHSHQQLARPGGLARLARLTGVWQLQHQKGYFPSTISSCRKFAMTITRPTVFLVSLSYLLVSGWAIGINISTTILFAQPESAGGYGYTTQVVGFLYFSPIVGIFLGELFGHFFNDWLAKRYIHRHGGVFEPEVRLWTAYISLAVMAPAFVLIGQTLKHHLSVVGLIFGWGLACFGLMTLSVAVTAYTLDCYATLPAELGGWINFARTFGGFCIGYFQEPWANKVGIDASFGTQAAVVAFAGVPVIIAHIWGNKLRARFGNLH